MQASRQNPADSSCNAFDEAGDQCLARGISDKPGQRNPLHHATADLSPSLSRGKEKKPTCAGRFGAVSATFYRTPGPIDLCLDGPAPFCRDMPEPRNAERLQLPGQMLQTPHQTGVFTALPSNPGHSTVSVLLIPEGRNACTGHLPQKMGQFQRTVGSIEP